MRLKVPELIRHFDDNLRPKASNCSIVLWTLLRPKASNLRRIQYRFGTEAPKSVEFAPKSSYTLGPKLLLYYLLEAIYNFISIYIDDLCIYSVVFINKAYMLYINI